MDNKEFYGQQGIPREEIERMKAISYPTYVSETILNSFDLKGKKILDSAGAGPTPNLAEFVKQKGGTYEPLDFRRVDAPKGIDARELPFKDGSFDVVHERFVLMNIEKEDRPQALKEFMRVGKEKLVLLEYNDIIPPVVFIVPYSVGSENFSLWTCINITLLIVFKMLKIKIMVWSLTGGWNSRYCNNRFYSQVLCCFKF